VDEALRRDAGIDFFVADENMSVLEGDASKTHARSARINGRGSPHP
jgi:hypothetical protein